MLSPFLDILLLVISYVSLFVLRKVVLSSMKHSILSRATGFIAGWLFLFCLLDWFLNFVLITILAVTENVYLFYNLFFMLLVIVVGLRIALHPPEGFEVDDVKDFLRESLLFNNYLRRKDAESREEYDRFIVEMTHRETSDKPIELLSPRKRAKEQNRFAGITTESIGQEKNQKVTEKIRRETDKLRTGETIDITDIFRIELMNNENHRYLGKLNEFIIDPGKKTFSMRLSFPDSMTIDEKNEKQMNGLIGELYEMLQILQSEQWLQPYTPYFRTITLRVAHSVWGDLGNVTARDLFTISISLANLRRHDGRIMPMDSLKKIATIEYNSFG
jgi:hypothetical protein